MCLLYGLPQIAATGKQPRTFDGLAALLESQAYRLSYFRVAAEEINFPAEPQT